MTVKMKKIRYLAIAIFVLAFVWTGALAAQPSSYNTQVNNGVAYFRKRANDQLPLAENLLAALNSGDLDRAKMAYVDSRPPYEEIEVYAGSFEKEDTDIDSRPYVIDGGETSPQYKGFHRIESMIYRDGDLKSAVPYGEELVASLKSLIVKLNNPKNFNAALNFKGMLSLANEVPSKKISSEEETWSDQSLLIFKHNWIGIHSQFIPYKSVLSKNIVAEEESAYQDCLKTVAPFFRSGEIAAKPYSQVSMIDRGAIVRASYRYRDVLLKAKAALKIPDPA
ncbi:MAG: EfeM/EfeO family lipoprotein [Pseudanabaena sp. ELA645]|jgi:iron uptake system component EfeO